MTDELRYVHCQYIPRTGQVVHYENQDWEVLSLSRGVTGDPSIMASIRPVNPHYTGVDYVVPVYSLEVPDRPLRLVRGVRVRRGCDWAKDWIDQVDDKPILEWLMRKDER